MVAALNDPMSEHAEWLAAYDGWTPSNLPWPKREEVYVRVEFDGDFQPVIYERCAQCRQLDAVGKVLPYYIKAKGEGAPGSREVVIRWLHQGECADEWHAKYRAWLEGQNNGE